MKPVFPHGNAYRMIAGGSWFRHPEGACVEKIFMFTASYHDHDVGFRLVRGTG